MKTLKSILSKTGIYCMLMTVIYALILLAMEKGEYASITLTQYMSVVIFSLLLAAAGLLFNIEGLPSLVIWVIHYLVTVASFMIVFALFGNIEVSRPGQILVLWLAYTLIYIFLMGGKALIRFGLRRYLESDETGKKKPKEKEYTPLYK